MAIGRRTRKSPKLRMRSPKFAAPSSKRYRVWAASTQAVVLLVTEDGYRITTEDDVRIEK